MEMRRICIVGCSGAGKSTLSAELGKLTGLEVIYLDQHFWQPNWVETKPEIWAKKHRALCEGESWIIDGSYMRTLEERLEFADSVIFLDFPTFTCLKRVVWRTFSNHGKRRRNMAEDCYERFTFEFLWFVFRFRKTHRGRILERLFALDESKRVYHLKTPEDVAIFSKTFK